MTAHKLTCESAGVRLDKFLADAGLELSRSMAVTLIENGNVTVNGKPCSKKQKLSAGDTVDVTVPDAEPYEAKAEQIPLVALRRQPVRYQRRAASRHCPPD